MHVCTEMYTCTMYTNMVCCFNDLTFSLSLSLSLSELPEIRCAAPAGVGAGDLTVSWHGIRVTVTGWWKYNSPVVTSIQPSNVPYTGTCISILMFACEK